MFNKPQPNLFKFIDALLDVQRLVYIEMRGSGKQLKEAITIKINNNKAFLNKQG